MTKFETLFDITPVSTIPVPSTFCARAGGAVIPDAGAVLQERSAPS